MHYFVRFRNKKVLKINLGLLYNASKIDGRFGATTKSTLYFINTFLETIQLSVFNLIMYVPGLKCFVLYSI